jgi:hypothetical protein
MNLDDFLEDLLEERFSDATEDELDVFCADGAGEVGVDRVGGVVLFVEFLFDIRGGRLEITPSAVLRKADVQIYLLNLLSEQISLVEEENEIGVLEPRAVANLIEEKQRFLHSVLRVVLSQGLVVFGERRAE